MERVYTVVVNDESQYAVWPSGKVLPLGWSEVVPGIAMSKEECLKDVALRWQDLRPLSLRTIIQTTIAEKIQS